VEALPGHTFGKIPGSAAVRFLGRMAAISGLIFDPYIYFFQIRDKLILLINPPIADRL
jgi:hypothetical protein